MPLPSTLRWLCTSSESGASTSQNDALTGSRPALSPSSLHTTRLRSAEDHVLAWHRVPRPARPPRARARALTILRSRGPGDPGGHQNGRALRASARSAGRSVTTLLPAPGREAPGKKIGPGIRGRSWLKLPSVPPITEPSPGEPARTAGAAVPAMGPVAAPVAGYRGWMGTPARAVGPGRN